MRDDFSQHWHAKTPGAQEAAFQYMLDRTIPYFEKVVAEGDEPWFDSVEQRRELFMRRHQRPVAPIELTTNIDVIRGREVWTPTTPAEDTTEGNKAA